MLMGDPGRSDSSGVSLIPIWNPSSPDSPVLRPVVDFSAIGPMHEIERLEDAAIVRLEMQNVTAVRFDNNTATGNLTHDALHRLQL